MEAETQTPTTQSTLDNSRTRIDSPAKQIRLRTPTSVVRTDRADDATAQLSGIELVLYLDRWS
jgi:hypothetical protein